jgi:hypothetical protein
MASLTGELMEACYNFPNSGSFDPGGDTTVLATKLSEHLEGLALEQAKPPTIIGVGLFKVNPTDGSLEGWDPGDKENKAHNGAMVGAYKLNCSPWRDLARSYCSELVRASSVLAYLHSKRNDLTDFNVIVHLHYYRNREKPDPGFHKDTRGQTLFFMLHYLSALPIYGAEWMRDRGLQGRVSPAAVDGVWPSSIRQDVLHQMEIEPEDEKIHVFRVGAYGAVLVVDDIVHHRTPNFKSRSEWGFMVPNRLQVSNVQARDANHKNAYYEIERGRGRSRERSSDQEIERGRSRSRSLSNERDKKDNDEDTKSRWDKTFDSSVIRKFFRLWVTISHKEQEVWY